MPLRLNGSDSGYSELEAPAIAGDQTFTLPGTGGTIVTTAGTQTLTNKTIQGGALTLETAKTATGTSVDFTGIPSWVKRVTVMFDRVSTNGTSLVQVQLGTSTGFVTSGYESSGSIGSSSTQSNLTSGLNVDNAANAGNSRSGSGMLTLLTGNTWTWHFIGTYGGGTMTGGGSVVLSDTLTQIRITTVIGTQTFDAGSINIMYEG